MRNPFPGAFVASSASHAAGLDAASHRQQYLLRPTRRRRSLLRALSNELKDPDSGAIAPSKFANLWDFVAMGSRSKPDNDPEPDLVEDIARAMRSSPLMRRLASVEAEFGENPELAPAPAAAPVLRAPSLRTPALDRPVVDRNGGTLTAIAAGIGIAPGSFGGIGSDLDEIKRRVEEAEAGWTVPPRSAEWLGKAKRDHRRALLRNAAAWMATIFIGGSIIAATALMLQP
jgi:hypothetical protein